jgi:hypothetical protein
MNSLLQQKIRAAVLAHLQLLLRQVKDRDESVVMSEDMYVEERDRPSHVIPPGKVLAKWKIKREEIAALELSSPKPAHVAMGKNYYRTAWGEFAIDEDATIVIITYKLSPKFGHGDRYQIITDAAQNVTLQRLKPTWDVLADETPARVGVKPGSDSKTQ